MCKYIFPSPPAPDPCGSTTLFSALEGVRVSQRERGVSCRNEVFVCSVRAHKHLISPVPALPTARTPGPVPLPAPAAGRLPWRFRRHPAGRKPAQPYPPRAGAARSPAPGCAPAVPPARALLLPGRAAPYNSACANPPRQQPGPFSAPPLPVCAACAWISSPASSRLCDCQSS